MTKNKCTHCHETIRVYKNTTEIPTIHKKCIKEIEQRKKHVKQYHQNYYLENKQKIIDGMSEKMHCPYCDIQITKCKLDRHHRSNKHRRNVVNFDELH